MWARLDDLDYVAEVVTEDPTGRFHPDLRFVPVPTGWEPYIDGNFSWDGQKILEPEPGMVLRKARTAKRQEFDQVFESLDAQRVRPVSTLLCALLAEDAPLPVGDDNIDADQLWQAEEVAAENRRLLVLLEATDSVEAVQKIIPWQPVQRRTTRSGQ